MRFFGMHDAFMTSLENTLKEQMTQDQFIFCLGIQQMGQPS